MPLKQIAFFPAVLVTENPKIGFSEVYYPSAPQKCPVDQSRGQGGQIALSPPPRPTHATRLPISHRRSFCLLGRALAAGLCPSQPAAEFRLDYGRVRQAEMKPRVVRWQSSILQS